MLTLAVAALGYAPTAPLRTSTQQASRTAGVAMETVDDLKSLSDKCNPSIGYWNPLCLGETSLGSAYSSEEAIGFLRHAELKHGRVAMAAFVGFCVQSNGIHFPWALTTSGITFADISAAGGPAAQWDALPTNSKLNIFGAILFLELWGEASSTLGMSGEKHYMRGGKPGFFPSLKTPGALPHPVPLDLWDPFGFTSKMTPERKAKSLVAEINNGRLAMIGIMGMMAASKGLIVPGLDTVGVAPYGGEVMAPFAAGDSGLPYVGDMLGYSLPSGAFASF